MRKNILNYKNKRAMFFSMISLLFSALFIMLYSHTIELPIDNDIFVINTRVNVLDSYTKTFEDYTAQSLASVTYKTLESMNDYIGTNGFYNSEQEVKDVFVDCSLNITTNKCPNIENDTLPKFLNKIIEEGKNTLHIESTYNINSLSIYQRTYSYVSVVLNITYIINDSYALWNRTKVLEIMYPLEGMRDPYYYGNSYGSNERKITFTKTNPGEWNETAFVEFYNNEQYKICRNCSSFLMKFANLTSNSTCCGIESIVNASKVSRRNTSYVDHYYWTKFEYVCDCSGGSQGNYTDLYNITIPELNGDKNPYLDIISVLYYDIKKENTQEIPCSCSAT